MKSAILGAILAAAVVVALVFGVGVNAGMFADTYEQPGQETVRAPAEPSNTATN